MKKFLYTIIVGICCSILFSGCQTLQEVDALRRCEFAIYDIQSTKISTTNIYLEIDITVTNPNKHTIAKINAMDLTLNANSYPITKVEIDKVVVQPQETRIVKTDVTIPYSAMPKVLTGAVAMGSVDYDLEGIVYFDTAFGEITQIITVYNSNNTINRNRSLN